MAKTKQQKQIATRKRRHARVRSRISGTAMRPRLAVNRSNAHIYAQLIDDSKGVTLAYADDKGLSGTKIEKATKVGETIATKAKKKDIKEIVFDRGGFRYTGRVQALAEGARKAGLEF